MLKPLSVAAGEILFAKGAVSNDLLFLLDGEVDVISEYDHKTPVRRIRTSGETLLSEQDGTELVTVDSVGCLGQSALVGRRRPATHVARTFCELLIIERPDLLKLFKAAPSDARRLCTLVLSDYDARERLRNLSFALRKNQVANEPDGSGKELKSAYVMQYIWRRYCGKRAQEEDELNKLITQIKPKASSTPKRSQASTAELIAKIDKLTELVFALDAKFEERQGKGKSGQGTAK